MKYCKRFAHKTWLTYINWNFIFKIHHLYIWQGLSTSYRKNASYIFSSYLKYPSFSPPFQIFCLSLSLFCRRLYFSSTKFMLHFTLNYSLILFLVLAIYYWAFLYFLLLEVTFLECISLTNDIIRNIFSEFYKYMNDWHINIILMQSRKYNKRKRLKYSNC